MNSISIATNKTTIIVRWSCPIGYFWVLRHFFLITFWCYNVELGEKMCSHSLHRLRVYVLFCDLRFLLWKKKIPFYRFNMHVYVHCALCTVAVPCGTYAYHFNFQFYFNLFAISSTLTQFNIGRSKVEPVPQSPLQMNKIQLLILLINK